MRSMRPYPNKRFIAAYLDALNKRDKKYGILLLLGIETGLRISDILRLRVKDIGKIIRIREGKTRKWKTVVISDMFLTLFFEYKKIASLRSYDSIFYRYPWNRTSPISRGHAWRVMRDVGRDLGLERLGTHSLRKSYAKRLFNASGEVSFVQRLMNHKYPDTTLRYLIDFPAAGNGLSSAPV